MINHWFEPSFPINVIYDITTYLLSFFYFYYLFKKIINTNLFYLSIISLLTPFFFNGFLFHWSYLPDQSKYIAEANNLRQTFLYNPLDFNGFIKSLNMNSLYSTKIKIPALIYSFSPIISLETFKGVAIWNRALFLLMIIFLIRKKLL